MTVTHLDERRPVLGGSTIAAAAGVDPWVSPIRLWIEMSGRIQREQTEAMRIGKALEPVVFGLLREEGHEVERTPGASLRDPALPWIEGHPDGYGVQGDRVVIVEAKATARPTDTLPIHHEAQVQIYMHLARQERAIVAQLGGLTLTTWEVDYRERLAECLIELGARFVDSLRAGEMPAPMGHADDRAALGLAWNVTPGRKVRETREVRDARRELASLVEAERRRKERIEHLRARITAYMGDAETLLSSHDDVVATWKETTTTRTDVKGIRDEYPDVAARFVTQQPTRRFLLK